MPGGHRLDWEGKPKNVPVDRSSSYYFCIQSKLKLISDDLYLLSDSLEYEVEDPNTRAIIKKFDFRYVIKECDLIVYTVITEAKRFQHSLFVQNIKMCK